MDDVIYRPITKEDYPQIKRILCDIWHFDRYVKSERALEVLLQMLMHSYLCAQNYTRIALRDAGSCTTPWEFSGTGCGCNLWKMRVRASKYRNGFPDWAKS